MTRDSTSDRCPCCGQPTPAQSSTLELLRQWAIDHGHHVCADDSVYEDCAALLIDRQPNTLSNWRSNGGGNVPFRKNGRTGRVRYRLADLAAYIDASGVTD